MSRINWTKSQLASTKAGQSLFGETSDESTKESRADKMRASRKKTTGLTKWVIDYLNDSMEFVVNRSNNIPSTRTEIIKQEGKADILKFHHKKNNIKFKILDVQGFRISDGKHCEFEMKLGKDSLSTGQKERIQQLQKAGCICFVITSKETFLEQIKPYLAEQKLAF